MKKNHLFLLLFSIFFASSCTPSLQFLDINPKEIKKNAIPKPMTSVYSIEKGNDQIFDAKLSDSMTQTAWKCIDQFTPRRIERNLYQPVDSVAEQKYKNAVRLVMQKINKYKNINNINALPDSVIEVFAQSGADLVLCSMTEGFVRTESNYDKEQAKELGRAILVGIIGGLVGGAIAGSVGARGASFNVSYYGGGLTKHASVTFLFMVDIKSKNLVYFDKFLEASDPTIPQYVQRNIGTLLNKYFSQKKVKPKMRVWRY